VYDGTARLAREEVEREARSARFAAERAGKSKDEAKAAEDAVLAASGLTPEEAAAAASEKSSAAEAATAASAAAAAAGAQPSKKLMSVLMVR
jgi:hypothetical protein